MKIGMTQPLFQLVGNCPTCRDFVNKMCKGKHIESAVALRTTGGLPSGPGGLAILILDNFSKIASTVKPTDSIGIIELSVELEREATFLLYCTPCACTCESLHLYSSLSLD